MNKLGRPCSNYSMEHSKRRRRRSAGANFSYIPEEIILNILPRLPIYSLLRFRCVSKQWCRLISETNVRRQKLLIKSAKILSDEHRLSFVSIDKRVRTKPIGEYRTTIQNGLYWHRRVSVKILGSCNGLLLIKELDDLFLWNPAVRYCRKVLTHRDLDPFNYVVVASGLFFDSYDNAYKAVIASSFDALCDHCEFVLVACLKTKSCTRISCRYRIIRTGPVLNDNLHWLACEKGLSDYCSEPNFIIYFDTRRNVFAKFPMPRPKRVTGDNFIGLGVLDGCLCVARCEGPPGSYECDVEVLTMKEYGVKESWTFLFRIDRIMPYRDFVPFYYTEKKDEVLMRVERSGKDVLIKYDTKSKRCTEIKRLKYDDEMVAYEETMVKPVGYGGRRKQGFINN